MPFDKGIQIYDEEANNERKWLKPRQADFNAWDEECERRENVCDNCET